MPLGSIIIALVASYINFSQPLWAQVIAYLMVINSLEVVHDILCIPLLTSSTMLYEH